MTDKQKLADALMAEAKSTDAKLAAASLLLKALDELANEAHAHMTGGAGHLIDNAWHASAVAKAAGITFPEESPNGDD